MRCPECNNAELDESGNCPACGFVYSNQSEPPEPQRSSEFEPAHMGAIPVDYTGPADNAGPELPAWRQELSRRLQEIKRKRETPEQSVTEEETQLPPFPPESDHPVVDAVPPAEQPPRRRPETPKPPPPLLPAASQPPAAPLPDAEVRAASEPRNSLRLVQPPRPAFEQEHRLLERSLAETKEGDTQAGAIRELIDTVTRRQSIVYEATPRILVPPPVPSRHGEGKLILLSRTLGGLVDLLIVILCTGAFVLTIDFVSGIDVLDSTSILHYALLLLAIHLLYSMFFLGSANQTIGMMITDLRVVGAKGERAKIGRLILRCFLYLPALLALALGLIWAVFDSDSLCLHDRLSGTSVVRA